MMTTVAIAIAIQTIITAHIHTTTYSYLQSPSTAETARLEPTTSRTQTHRYHDRTPHVVSESSNFVRL